MINNKVITITKDNQFDKGWTLFLPSSLDVNDNPLYQQPVTSDLVKRVYEHKTKAVEGFTKRYGVDKLGYYEVYEDINLAIKREKQIKGGSRKNKLKLIESMNPDWKDLYNDIIE